MTADTQLTAGDQRAREAALDVTESFIVQAPAGSGKTELLIQRYLCLLATVENPEEVLAITFTRKAAAEMRLRVLLALQKAHAGERPEEQHEQVTFDAAMSVLKRDQQSNWGLLESPRRLRIQTLDALNTAIARMQPMTSGASTGAAVVDMAMMNSLYGRAAAATLDWLGDRGYAGEATEEVLLHIDNNTTIYIAYLSRMLITRDQWLPFISSGAMSEEEARRLRQRFENSLAKVISGHLESTAARAPQAAMVEILALKDYAITNLRKEGLTDSPVLALADMDDVMHMKQVELGVWQSLAEFLLTKDGGVRRQIDKRIGFPPANRDMKQRFADLLESIADETEWTGLLHRSRELPPARYSDEQWSVLRALFHLLPVAVAELKRLAAIEGVTDYIEIALSAGTALGTAQNPGDVALLLDYQVRHILIDEMQDTSKAQYRMLEALTGGWQNGDGRSLFCVGDPMQSIYRFRNAEVAQFLLARENGINDVQLQALVLRRNFRSGEKLVHWFNSVFPFVLANHDDPGSGAVAYSEAVPVERFSGQGDVQLYPVIGSDRQLEARQSFQVIERLLNEHREDDVAVLVRGRSALPALLTLLREANIAYQAIDLDRLTDLPEIIDVLALTRALAHYGDRLAWLALLRAPWLGLSWTDIHELVFEARHLSVYELLLDNDRLTTLPDSTRTSLRRFIATLQPILVNDRSTPLHQRVERAWYTLGGPALLDDANAVANVNRYFEVLASLEIGGTLADIAELENRLDEERVSTSGAARLQIMTMHKAKGLQFDHVVLHGLGRRPKPPTPAVISWFDLPDAHGREDKIISPVGRRDDVDRDPIHRFIERTELAKDTHEKARLLYVACTRARQSLHLIGHAEISKDGSRLNKPVASTLLALLWPIVGDQYDAAFSDMAAAEDTEAAATFVNPALRRFESPWELPGLPAVPGQEAEPEDAGSGYEVEYYWVGANARLAGTIVHRWLQYAAEGRIELAAGQLNALRPVSRRWLSELGAGRDMLGDIENRVVKALEGVLGDVRGQWLLEGEGAAELALTGVINRKLQSIVIDRVRIDDDGTHWIVDYKTSTHEGGKLGSFLQAEADRYRGQLTRYAQIYGAYADARPRCALYFPLLREFVEVDVVI